MSDAQPWDLTPEQRARLETLAEDMAAAYDIELEEATRRIRAILASLRPPADAEGENV